MEKRNKENGQFERKYILNDDFLKKLDPTKAWFLGLMAADGYIKKSYIHISQSGNEGRRLINYTKKLISSNGIIRSTQPMKNGKPFGRIVYSFDWTSTPMAKDFEKYNITQNKSFSYSYPEILPDEFFLDFLRGYIDGDGCVGSYYIGHKNKPRLLITLYGNEKFITTIVAKSIKNLGIDCKFYKQKKGFQMRWVGKNAVKFGKMLYQNEVYKGKKYKIFKTYLKTYGDK
jgi:hypothetical protein